MSEHGSNEQPIIIRKKKKKGGHAPHGGAWKVAYADFVTAMMAFFLLLWLVNMTTEEQRRGIANYFDPMSPSRSSSGSGGVLGGTSVITEGALTTERAPLGMEMPDTGFMATQREDHDGDGSSPGGGDDGMGAVQSEAIDGDSAERGMDDAPSEAERLREERAFREAERQLRRAMEQDPALRNLGGNVLIDRDEDGMRIQLIDQDNRSMFETGSATPQDHTRRLLAEVAEIASGLPNAMTITGHTDGAAYRAGADYDNWNLSSDRAISSRRVMVDAGLPADRVERVVGRADQDLLVPGDPLSPLNRRITIHLMSDAAAAAPLPQEALGAGGSDSSRATEPATPRLTDELRPDPSLWIR